MFAVSVKDGKRVIMPAVLTFGCFWVLILTAAVVGAAEKGPKPVAKVDGEIITDAYVVALKATLPRHLAIRPDAITEFAVRRRLVSIEARRLGLDKQPDVRAMLEARRDEILTRAYWVKVGIKEIGVSDDAVKSYYDAYPEKFRFPERVRFYWAVSGRPDGLQRLKGVLAAEKVLERRKEIFVREARKGGVPFPILAGKGEAPWDSGFVEVKKLPTSIRKDMAGAEEGAVVGPVKDGGLYYLFLVIGRKEAETIPLDMVKDEIKAHLLRRKQHDFMMERIKKLRQRIKVEILEDREH